MKSSLPGWVAAMAAATLLCGCGKTEAPKTVEPPPVAQPSAAAVIAAAVNDTTRLAAARLRDPERKPAEILAFAGVEPGDTIVELAPGSGYVVATETQVSFWVDASGVGDAFGAHPTTIGDLGGFMWVDTYPDLATWAKVWDGDDPDISAAFDEIETCSSNRLYSGTPTEAAK